MQRFFVPPPLLQQSAFELPEEVAHHLRSVLRLRSGEEILLLDGLGAVCRCRIETLERRCARVLTLERWQEGEEAFPIHLLQGLPKGDKMDLVLQKGTELGISTFTPLLAGRSVPSRSAGQEARRHERWERIIREAARQCRRPLLPRLLPATGLAEGLASCSDELRLMLWEEGSRPLGEVLAPARARSAAVLVGPEGGFSAAEAEAARTAGFVPVRLGPRILRTETAGLAVASIIQYLFGDLGAATATPQ